MYEPSYRTASTLSQSLNMTRAALRALADPQTGVYTRPLLELARYRKVKVETLRFHLRALEECGEVERTPRGFIVRE